MIVFIGGTQFGQAILTVSTGGLLVRKKAKMFVKNEAHYTRII